jgi:hypothetical protein
VAGISLLHAWLNLNVFGRGPTGGATSFKVGFLPVT